MPETAQERIPYSCQTIDDDDIAAVADCLRSQFLTQGPKTTQFERETADYIGAARGVAVSNGTAALHLLYQALGVNQNSLLLSLIHI